MILRAFKILIIALLPFTVMGQYRLSGTVVSKSDSSYVKDCSVYLDNGKMIAITDSHGKFIFADVQNGKYTLHFMSPDFSYHKTEANVTDADAHIRVSLEPRNQVLEEVTVTDVQTGFGFTRMHAVENMGIYEGKKSEVIIPEQLVANLATNNARQIYARVAGLNIWENDGAGLQLSIGGRGLDPNRTSNFNVRQNGYDISADALGYPESYYTPPIEGVGRVEIVRGAASLQYGTQFGGLVNFIMKKPVTNRKLELLARQSVGSYGFYNSFTSASGTLKKLSYYTFFQYKRGDGWRENSEFDNHTVYGNVNYALTSNTTIGLDITQMGYVARQPGGLSDSMFGQDARQSIRERNWFKVNWNMLAFRFDHKFNSSRDLNVRLFGLSAKRYSVGFRPNRVATIDDNTERDLIKGDFRNWGAEIRFLNRYNAGKIPGTLLIGSRYYQGSNYSTQGLGSTGIDADFRYVNPDEYITYDYHFPNRNVSLFAENIFYLHDKFSVTPGIRYEHIHTTAEGYYGTIYRDLANNIIDITKTTEYRRNGRQFILAGVGLSFKPTARVDIYSNISQNFRSITFSDMRISNPSLIIDPEMEDEKGYSLDLGIRSDQTVLYNYDVSAFFLNYNNRIGEVQFYDSLNRVLRKRGNIGQAVISGIEAYGEIDIIGYLQPGQDAWSGVLFNNVAFIYSNYRKSEENGVRGNKVEFVPDINLKAGFRLGYRKIKASFQFTHLSQQFTDATNAFESDASAVVGVIPSYSVMDLSLSWEFKKIKVEGTANNLANRMYFTRRATGYPGPGILPSDGRTWFLTLQIKL